MEARIARLESDVAHLRTDVADIKIDVRALRDKMDVMFTKLSDKIDSATRWTIGLYIALAAAMLGTMASGFGWI
jgi:uncharacterized coiled-coil protein SlyX